MRRRNTAAETLGIKGNPYSDAMIFAGTSAGACESANGAPAAPSSEADKNVGRDGRPMSAAESYSGPAFLPPSAAARVLGIGESTCRKWCCNGTLPAVKTGAKYLIPMKKSLDLLERRAASNCRYLEV